MSLIDMGGYSDLDMPGGFGSGNYYGQSQPLYGSREEIPPGLGQEKKKGWIEKLLPVLLGAGGLAMAAKGGTGALSGFGAGGLRGFADSLAEQHKEKRDRDYKETEDLRQLAHKTVMDLQGKDLREFPALSALSDKYRQSLANDGKISKQEAADIIAHAQLVGSERADLAEVEKRRGVEADTQNKIGAYQSLFEAGQRLPESQRRGFGKYSGIGDEDMIYLDTAGRGHPVSPAEHARLLQTREKGVADTGRDQARAAAAMDRLLETLRFRRAELAAKLQAAGGGAKAMQAWNEELNEFVQNYTSTSPQIMFGSSPEQKAQLQEEAKAAFMRIIPPPSLASPPGASSNPPAWNNLSGPQNQWGIPNLGNNWNTTKSGVRWQIQ